MNVRGCSSGEPGAPSIETIYELYRPQILRFFMSKGLQRDTAEDLTQEVFFRLLRSGKPMANEEYTHNLVFRIAQNLAIDHFRKNNGTVQERAGVEDDIADRGHPTLVSPISPEDVFISTETSSDVITVLSRLPDRHAQAIVSRELQGMSYREMAETMGISEKAAESLLHRARTQLKCGLAEAGERRGGWWSAIPLLPGAFTRSLARRVSSLSRAALKKAAGLSTGAGAVGFGYSALNIVVVIILVGSLVCLGVVSAGAVRQPAPTARRVTQVPAGRQGPEAASSGEPAGDSGTASAPARPEKVAQPPGTAEMELLSGLLAQPGDAARGLLGNTGHLLDDAVAQLGGLLGTLTDPVFMILAPIGLPPGVVSALQGVCSMGMARLLAATLVDKTAGGTYLVDGVVNAVMPPGTDGSATANPAAAATTPAGQDPGAQEVTAVTGEESTGDTGAVQQNTQPAQPPAAETQPSAPADQQNTIVEDLVQFLQDTLLPF